MQQQTSHNQRFLCFTPFQIASMRDSFSALHFSGTPLSVSGSFIDLKMTHFYSILDSINNRQLVWSVHESQAPLFFNDVKIK